MAYLGIDLGTSGVKAMLIGEGQEVLATAHCPLNWTSSNPGWAEQDPANWWRATQEAIAQVREAEPAVFMALRCIALSGQMHGATLLDRHGDVVRPAMLWNDTRAHLECEEIELSCPDARKITGNLVMPGFTAPKLLWVKRHEPDLFKKVHTVLLPKDYITYKLSGDLVTDMSDASGTSWLDVSARCWSERMLAATSLDVSAMPRAVEGGVAATELAPSIRRAWGISHPVFIAAGAGDNAAAAVGMGVVNPDQALISLGTSGVVFTGNDRFLPNPDEGVHAFCHCLPGRWHQMTVILSAAASVNWLSEIFGVKASEIARLAAEADPARAPLFLPYLNGERSPHNDPHARGVFFGLSTAHGTRDLAYAVLEGVAFAISDGQRSLSSAGTHIDDSFLVGGGSRSPFWARLIASATGIRLHSPLGADLGGAFGAARLAQFAVFPGQAEDIFRTPATAEVIHPEKELQDCLAPRYEKYRGLYRALKGYF